MIYFIEGNEAVKIGYTGGDPLSRLRSLQTASPSELRLVAVMDGTPRDEGALHAKFHHLHLRGEWFRPADDLADFVATHARLTGISRLLQRRVDPT